MYFRLFCILMLLLCRTTFGQKTEITFYEIIEGDSIRMFFNQRGNFTEKECADFIRYVKLDTMANFDSYFEDVSLENKLLAKGTYQHGIRNGYFEVYYPEGKAFCRGNYRDNLPFGQWEFFHENGSPDRTLQFTETDTLLITSYDEDAKLKVSQGNGNFKDYVGGNTGSCYNEILAKGKIVNGKPDGKWTADFAEQPFCVEKYENGKLVRGEFPQALSNDDKYYKDKPVLYSFFLNNYLSCLENYKVESCADSSAHVKVSYVNGNQKFLSELRRSIEWVINNDYYSRSLKHCLYGDNQLSLSFQ